MNKLRKMSQNGKVMPNLDQHSTKILNLTVLQRIDPYVEEILITAAHVTFYEFNIDDSQWSRKDVEGSLFVVKRNTQPRFQFIVMNRRNTENLVENLLGDFEYEIQVPYLLYRNAAQEVNGIWFYNSRECEEVANLFSRILNAYGKVPPRSNITSAKSGFEELEAVPSMSLMDGPLELSSTTPTNVTDLPDDPAFVNFFSGGLAISKSPHTGISGQPYPQPSSSSIGSFTTPQMAPCLSASTLESSECGSSRATNYLMPPSLFAPPPLSSSSLPSPQPHPPVYGTPLLQPFPPPTPPPSLTPPTYTSLINRDKVRDALLMLVQDNQFIDMVYRAVVNAHNT